MERDRLIAQGQRENARNTPQSVYDELDRQAGAREQGKVDYAKNLTISRLQDQLANLPLGQSSEGIRSQLSQLGVETSNNRGSQPGLSPELEAERQRQSNLTSSSSTGGESVEDWAARRAQRHSQRDYGQHEQLAARAGQGDDQIFENGRRPQDVRAREKRVTDARRLSQDDIDELGKKIQGFKDEQARRPGEVGRPRRDALQGEIDKLNKTIGYSGRTVSPNGSQSPLASSLSNNMPNALSPAGNLNSMAEGESNPLAALAQMSQANQVGGPQVSQQTLAPAPQSAPQSAPHLQASQDALNGISRGGAGSGVHLSQQSGPGGQVTRALQQAINSRAPGGASRAPSSISGQVGQPNLGPSGRFDMGGGSIQSDRFDMGGGQGTSSGVTGATGGDNGWAQAIVNAMSGGGNGERQLTIPEAIQKSYDDVRAEEEARYEVLRGGENDEQAAEGGYVGAKTRLQELQQGLGDSARQDISDRYSQRASNALQSLIGNRLSNTTVAEARDRGLREGESTDLRRLNELLRRESRDLEERTTDKKLQFMERLTRKSPDIAQMLALAQQTGNAGPSGYGGGIGGGTGGGGVQDQSVWPNFGGGQGGGMWNVGPGSTTKPRPNGQGGVTPGQGIGEGAGFLENDNGPLDPYWTQNNGGSQGDLPGDDPYWGNGNTTPGQGIGQGAGGLQGNNDPLDPYWNQVDSGHGQNSGIRPNRNGRTSMDQAEWAAKTGGAPYPGSTDGTLPADPSYTPPISKEDFESAWDDAFKEVPDGPGEEDWMQEEYRRRYEAAEVALQKRLGITQREYDRLYNTWFNAPRP